MAKLTDQTALTTPNKLDVIHVVDVSDTADDAAGSSKKVALQHIPSAIATEIKTAYEGNADTNVLTDAEKTLLGNTSGTNTGDQTLPTALADLSADATHRLVTDTEKSTWNGKQDALPAASQAEMEAGTETAVRSMSPLRVKQAIDALGGSGGATAINDLTDVDTTGKAAGRILVFDASGNLVVGDDQTGEAGSGITTVTAGTGLDGGGSTSSVTLSIEQAILDAITANTAKVSFDPASSARLADTSGSNTGDQDLTGKQDILVEGPFVDGDKDLLDNAQPSLGIVGTAGMYFIEESVLGVTGKGVPGAWKLFYTDGSGGGIKELNIGTTGHLLKSSGTGGAPSFVDPNTLNNLTLSAAAANAFSAGSVGYLHTDGTVILADADTEATTKPLLLMSTANISEGGSGVFSRGGMVTVAGHGFSVGLPIFLSETAGGLTQTAPGTGKFVRLIGYPTDANTILFNPSNVWVEVA